MAFLAFGQECFSHTIDSASVCNPFVQGGTKRFCEFRHPGRPPPGKGVRSMGAICAFRLCTLLLSSLTIPHSLILSLDTETLLLEKGTIAWKGEKERAPFPEVALIISRPFVWKCIHQPARYHFDFWNSCALFTLKFLIKRERWLDGSLNIASYILARYVLVYDVISWLILDFLI